MAQLFPGRLRPERGAGGGEAEVEGESREVLRESRSQAAME
ncbi:MAG: hypothetical protein QOF41_2319 [Methylobacteriaceae bacterium]|nr:hypothetical protein [Methylobacteriaceae bacterium]